MAGRELLKWEIEEYYKSSLGEEAKKSEIKKLVDRTKVEITEPVEIWGPFEFEEGVIYNPLFLEQFILPEKLNKIRDSIMPNFEETFKVFSPLRRFIFNLDKLRDWLIKKKNKEQLTPKDIEVFRNILGRHYSTFEKEVEKYSKNYPEIAETITSIVDSFYNDINSQIGRAMSRSYDPGFFDTEIGRLISLLHHTSRGYFDMYNDAFVTSYEAIKEKSKEKLEEVV